MTTTTFEYKARDKAGKLVTGSVDAPNEAVVISRLRQNGQTPVSITAKNAGLDKEIKIPGLSDRGPSMKDLAVFSRQFATMINSGLSLIRSLNILAEQVTNKKFAAVLNEVRNDVESGSALSTAFGKHPRIFPAIMVNMTRAGEVGGFLDQVLLQLADNFEAEVKLRSKVKSAMAYPIVVFILSILMVIVMLLFIVPVFKKMFEQLGAQLPLPTQILVDLSSFLKTFFLPILVLIIALAVIWSRIKLDPRVRDVVDPMKLRMPVFGQLFAKISLSRFARNLGTLMKAGVPILQSLDIVADTTGNVVIARAVREVQESVRHGESIAGPLANHSVFPPMVVQMIGVGEDTGALDAMLLKISDFFDQEVEATTDALTSLIEPLMIAFLGALVGSMIVALYLPIFDIYNLVK